MVSSTWVPVQDQEGEPRYNSLDFAPSGAMQPSKIDVWPIHGVFTAPLESDTPSSAGGFSCQKYLFNPFHHWFSLKIQMTNSIDLDDHLSSAMTVSNHPRRVHTTTLAVLEWTAGQWPVVGFML